MIKQRQRLRRKMHKWFEYDLIYGKHIYCYLSNPKVAKWIKRYMNKRIRREGKVEIN